MAAAKPNQHGYRSVASKWSSGNLQFLDASGNVIYTIDAANRKVTIPASSTLDTSAGTLTFAAGQIAAPSLVTGGAIANAATLTPGAGVYSKITVNPAGAVTGIILAAGTADGQECTVVNLATAANSVTFAAAGTSHVSNGVSSVIAGIVARTFIWDSGTSLWYPQV